MPRTVARAGSYQAASRQLRARSADGFVDSVGVNADIGPQNPDYTATYNNDITVWAAKLQDIGIRKVRIANWLRPGDDLTLAKLAQFGVTPGYVIWDQTTYTELATGKYPVPNIVESYNEGYSFNSGPTARGSGAAMPMFGTGRGTFPYPWQSGVAYNVGDVVTVPGNPNQLTFYCKQAHTSTTTGATRAPSTCQLAAGSTGVALPQATITVDSTALTPETEIFQIYVPTGGGYQTVSFTGFTPTTFTGCTGGTGTTVAGTVVVYHDHFENAYWVNGWINDVRQIPSQRFPNLKTLPGWGNVKFASPSLYPSTPIPPTSTLGMIGALPNSDYGNYHSYQTLTCNGVEQVLIDANFPIPDPLTGNSLVIIGEIGGWRAGPINGIYQCDELSAATLCLRTLLYAYAHIGAPLITYLWELCDTPHSYQEGGPTDRQQGAGLIYATVNTNPGFSNIPFGQYKQSAIQLKRLIALLAEPAGFGTKGDGALLGVTPSGQTANLVTLLLAKSSGRFYLAVYLNVQVATNPNAPENLSGPYTITAATAAAPVQVTAAGHGRVEGETIVVSGATGLAGLNGTWAVHVVDPNTLTLTGSSGTGTYTANSASFVCYSMGKPVNTSQTVTLTFDRSFSAINLNDFRAGTVIPLGAGGSVTMAATQDVKILELIP